MTMHRGLISGRFLFFLATGPWPVLAAEPAADAPTVPFAIAIHGGASMKPRDALKPGEEAMLRGDLEAALEAGHAILARGGAAADAVVAAIAVLEDSPRWNAGRGAVLTAEGRVELDASIMEGHTQAAGAVAGVRTVRHPIFAARDVMRHSPHVLFAGEGAESFARERRLELVPNEWFITEGSRVEWRQWKAAQTNRAPEKAAGRQGTVGAVAFDRNGHLAAGTSTGGRVGKQWGRVGDSPIVGAGTWADDRCAVSCTGWGEFFIRTATAHEVSARMRLAGESLDAAATAALAEVARLGGNGGLISLDRTGRVRWKFNTSGMPRGFRLGNQPATVAFYPD